MSFFEIELKFKADDVKLEDFTTKAKSLTPSYIKVCDFGSHDYYYSDNDRFMRWRLSNTSPELTTKLKHHENNNIVRTEVNIPLKEVPSLEMIDTFSKMHKLEYDFHIWKMARVFYFSDVLLAYYLVYDANMKELDRFIEIEAREDVKFASPEVAKGVVETYERLMGFSPQRRIKLSLFERYSNRGR